jgi:hypothetical protein
MTESGENRQSNQRSLRIDRERLWATLLELREIGAVCPTAMVFVTDEDGGISHTPREYANRMLAAAGTAGLANAVLRLVSQG